MSEFHPSQNMPGCMIPDGGECCKGYAALHDEYFILKARIAELEAENFALAAHQCITPAGDEYGHFYCTREAPLVAHEIANMLTPKAKGET